MSLLSMCGPCAVQGPYCQSRPRPHILIKHQKAERARQVFHPAKVFGESLSLTDCKLAVWDDIPNSVCNNSSSICPLTGRKGQRKAFCKCYICKGKTYRQEECFMDNKTSWKKSDMSLQSTWYWIWLPWIWLPILSQFYSLGFVLGTLLHS